MARIIDVHNHLYPREWLDYLETRTQSPRMERTGPTSMIIYWQDVIVSHIFKPGHYDPEARIEDMDKAGIDVQILSYTIPDVDLLAANESVTWARKINDYYATVCQKYPGRFYASATLPYQDVDAALKELDRAYKDHNVKGITLFSNVNVKPIASPEFHPIYAKAEEHSLPVFLHPSVSLTQEIMKEHKISVALYGSTLDTTIAVMSLIWQGVLEKYPKLKIIHSHVGGMVPYLAGRLEFCWQLSSKDLGLKLAKTPSEYYKSQVYPDTIAYDFLPAMRCCLDFVGTDHFCFGTDYPHGGRDLGREAECVGKLGLSEDDTNKILSGNAAKIYKLP